MSRRRRDASAHAFVTTAEAPAEVLEGAGNTPAPSTLVAVTLVRPHTHAGRDYAAGAVIEVVPDTADWLEQLQVAHRSAFAVAAAADIEQLEQLRESIAAVTSSA